MSVVIVETLRDHHARIDTYGSLSLDLAIGTVERLATVFDHNFELFALFLGAYAPLAFVEAIETPGWLSVSASGALVADLAVKTRASDAVIAAFLSEPAMPDTSAMSTTTAGAGISDQTRWTAIQKARWMWIVANTSLLAPLVLAIAVLMFGARWLSEISDRRTEVAQELGAAQKALLNEQRSYIQELHRVASMRPDNAPPSDSTLD